MYFTYTALRFPVQRARVGQSARFIPLSALLVAICTSLGNSQYLAQALMALSPPMTAFSTTYKISSHYPGPLQF